MASTHELTPEASTPSHTNPSRPVPATGRSPRIGTTRKQVASQLGGIALLNEKSAHLIPGSAIDLSFRHSFVLMCWPRFQNRNEPPKNLSARLTAGDVIGIAATTCSRPPSLLIPNPGQRTAIDRVTLVQTAKVVSFRTVASGRRRRWLAIASATLWHGMPF